MLVGALYFPRQVSRRAGRSILCRVLTRCRVHEGISLYVTIVAVIATELMPQSGGGYAVSSDIGHHQASLSLSCHCILAIGCTKSVANRDLPVHQGTICKNGEQGRSRDPCGLAERPGRGTPSRRSIRPSSSSSE